jgi:hypothetical protein
MRKERIARTSLDLIRNIQSQGGLILVDQGQGRIRNRPLTIFRSRLFRMAMNVRNWLACQWLHRGLI